MDALRFANLTFRGLRRKDLLRDDGELKAIVTVNAEIIVEANQNPKLAEIINRSWSTLDGQWPYLLARWRSGRRDIEKISGSDFIYELCDVASKRELKVFLLGATPEVNREACARLHKKFGLQIAGHAPPIMKFPFPTASDREIMARLEAFAPDVLIICFGSPKQELWADSHLQELNSIGTRWIMGAGGTLDFVAGTVKRAPIVLQRAGLESLWRLALEPRVRIMRILRAFRFLRYA
jgi:N-acetylglucosaminyldiphosphoundecaprenol N-acetyl-beta-D-mannosaminyltransferase